MIQSFRESYSKDFRTAESKNLRAMTKGIKPDRLESSHHLQPYLFHGESEGTLFIFKPSKLNKIDF